MYEFSADETERLIALYKLEILDTPAERDFDDIVKLASQICNVPFSYISLIDADRQWYKSKYGLTIEGDVDRRIAICSSAIEQDDILEVPDCKKDERFENFPYITGDPNIRYYAGIPLKTNGYNVGTLCVCDTVPRTLTEEQVLAIKVLSKHAMHLMELRVKNKRLETLTETQNKIISIIGHDIRNPLAALRALLSLQSDPETRLTAAELIEVNDLLNKQLDVTVSLLENLVQWGKLQITEAGLENHRAVNLDSIVETTLREMEVAASLKGNILSKNIAASSEVAGNDAEIEFILRNLISNANKFTENGHIVVHGKKENDSYCISVTDTGIGMNEDAIAKVLTGAGAFISLGTKEERGSGLGLSLIREFLAKNNRKLSIKSELGKGTTVSFPV